MGKKSITLFKNEEKRMKYKAMVRPMGGGCWAIAETKGEAMRMLKRELKSTWSHLFDINAWIKSGEATCNIYEDAGTDSHEDDVYIETVPLI
jgi:hypothetical protein